MARSAASFAPVAISRVRDALARARTLPSFPYPWRDLEAWVEHQDSGAVPVLGYGSLVNAESAQRTITRDLPGNRVPVVAFGARREFTYRIPEGHARYADLDERARAALNTRVTYLAEDVLNGVVVMVGRDEIEAFREREIAYDLRPLVVMDWHGADADLATTYVLECPDAARDGYHRYNAEILPHAGYYELCREGARSFGDGFLRFWTETTFLGDGTSIADWDRPDAS